MRIIYSDQELKFDQKTIFLAGPTPSSNNVPSWRPEAIRILKEFGYRHTVFIPEYSHQRYGEPFDFQKQVEWEFEALEFCAKSETPTTRIVFWIPRDLKIMPGFTTNIEFGRYIDCGKVSYGRPKDSPKCDYMDWLFWKLYGSYIPIFSDLKLLLQYVLYGCALI